MQYRANSAPALLTMRGMPGVKNSKTIEPNALPPAASFFLTALSRIARDYRIGMSRFKRVGFRPRIE
jgi:hypothetical protein